MTKKKPHVSRMKDKQESSNPHIKPKRILNMASDWIASAHQLRFLGSRTSPISLGSSGLAMPLGLTQVMWWAKRCAARWWHR
jgi:hypothetical protein